MVGTKVAHVTEGISDFCFVRVPLPKDEEDDKDLCPEERFIVDFEQKTILDRKTGKIYVSYFMV